MFGLHLRFQLFGSCPPSKFKEVPLNGANNTTAKQFSCILLKNQSSHQRSSEYIILLLCTVNKYRDCRNNPVAERYGQVKQDEIKLKHY